MEVLREFPNDCIDCIITSPPYWNLRDYGPETKTIWGGDKNCNHEWGEIKKTLKHKSGETNPGKESWYKDKGASDDSGNQFCKKCGAWFGQLGLEPTLEMYLDHLLQITAELKRVLKPTGTMFWVHGDSYAQGCLVLQNSRLVERMVDEQEWCLRNCLIWYKPNSTPDSAKNRFTVDYEPIFFFVKSNIPQYWVNPKTGKITDKQPKGTQGIEGEDWEWKDCPVCNAFKGETKISPEEAEKFSSPRARYHRKCENKQCINGKVKASLWRGCDYYFEQQFEQYTEPLNRWGGDELIAKGKSIWDEGTGQSTYRNRTMRPNLFGRNKRCVWVIPTRPFEGAHFAVFPEALVEPMILAGCPAEVCKKCGKVRQKIIDNSERINTRPGLNVGNAKSGTLIDPNKELHSSELSKFRQKIIYKEIGYTDCGCSEGWNKGIVLDPFIGSGTTAVVAKKLGRDFIGIDINPKYVEMAKKRIGEIPELLFYYE